jgi:hypothetical protein
VLGAVAAFAVYLRLARTLATNSDGAAQALQAWDMLHGNPLLRGWTLGDVTFYTTELPEYMLVEAVRGLNQDVVHVAAALTYTLAVLLAALLATGASTGREAAARALAAVGIMLAPQLAAGTLTLLSSPDHIGTSVPVLLTWVIIDRARPRWYVPVVTSLLLGWAEVADPTVFYIGVLPLVIVAAVRVGRTLAGGPRARARGYDVALAAGALAGAAAAMVALHLIEAHGFHAFPASTSLSPAGTIVGHNLGMTGDGLLLLAGADFLVWPAGVTAAFTGLHLVGLVLGGCGIAVAAWRFPRERDLVAQVLLVGIVINLASYLAGVHAAALANTREIADVLPLGAALAGRLLGPWLAGTRTPGTRAGTGVPDTGTGTGTGVAGTGVAGTGVAGTGVAETGIAETGIAETEAVGTEAGRPEVARTALAGSGVRGAGLRRWLAAVLGVVLASYAAGLGYELSQPTVPIQAEPVADWLAAHHLSSGLSGFWAANAVTLATGERVSIRPVHVAHGRVTPSPALRDADWYDPADATADFVVLYPGVAGYPGGLPGYASFDSMPAVLATFGRPAATYRVGPSTVLVWHKNILTDLPH